MHSVVTKDTGSTDIGNAYSDIMDGLWDGGQGEDGVLHESAIWRDLKSGTPLAAIHPRPVSSFSFDSAGTIAPVPA